MKSQNMTDEQAGNHAPNAAANSHHDSFICIRDELVDVCYALHPVHFWPDHNHKRHLFLLMLDDNASGELTWLTPDGQQQAHKQELTGRQICFIEKNLTHSFKLKVPSSLVCLYVSDALVSQIAPNGGWNGVIIYQWAQLMHRDLLALALAKLMAELCRQHENLHPLHLRAAGILLGVQLLRIRQQAKIFDRKSAELDSAQLERVLNWITTHLADKIVVNDLARIAGVSKDHFGRKFKESTGYAPHRFILIERVHRALELLEKGGMRMSEIAAESGFTDQSHLSRNLREFYGRMMSGKKQTD